MNGAKLLQQQDVGGDEGAGQAEQEEAERLVAHPGRQGGRVVQGRICKQVVPQVEGVQRQLRVHVGRAQVGGLDHVVQRAVGAETGGCQRKRSQKACRKQQRMGKVPPQHPAQRIRSDNRRDDDRLELAEQSDAEKRSRQKRLADEREHAQRHEQAMEDVNLTPDRPVGEQRRIQRQRSKQEQLRAPG